MTAVGVTTSQLVAALQSQNVQIPGGKVEQGLRDLTLRTYGRVLSPGEFANIPVSSNAANGGVFSKEGLIYVSEVEPVMEPEEDDKSLRGIELNLWGSYVWGTYRPPDRF